MVGLVDLAPRAERVPIEGAEVTVHGISAKGLAYLLGRFPDLRRLMSGQDVGVDQLPAAGGDAVEAIIAAGCGAPVLYADDGTGTYLIMYQDTGVTGLPLTPDGSDVQVVVDAAGWFAL